MSMILARTPLRISFFGGGSDYPAWFEHGEGAVLSTAIDKYLYISCRYLPPFLGIRHRIVWRHVELVDCIAEILHPAIREGLKYLEFDDREGLELHYQGDLPARSGMGSSSSFIVGFIHALMSLKGIELDAHALAKKAIDLEQNVMKETVGSQDQVVAAFGGLNVIRFRAPSEFAVSPLGLSPVRETEFLSRLMLIYPGQSRIASEVASSVARNLQARAANVRRMVLMVDEAARILRNGTLDDIGGLLDEAWQLKRGLSDRVSSERIDQLYDKAREAGALGGKLLGAGGTGFMLFYVPLERQEPFRHAMSDCLHVPFAFDQRGSCIVYRADESNAP